MRVAFFGSPEFAVPTLRTLLRTEEVIVVVTQPDKPAGRGQKVVAPAVKIAAEEARLRVMQPRSAKDPQFHEELRALAPDVAIVVAYGKILPQALLDVPKHGCLNVHASILPEYRGAAPIQWAIIRGEIETGVTIMKLDAGMDTGPIGLARTVAIKEHETAGELSPRLAAAGADLMLVALERLKHGRLEFTAQDHSLASMAPLLDKEDGRIDWSRDAKEIACLVRGVDPWPAAFTTLDGEILKVWGARTTEGKGDPGQVIAHDDSGLIVACGGGAVALRELQLPGRKRLATQQFLAGRAIPPGTRLGVAAAGA